MPADSEAIQPSWAHTKRPAKSTTSLRHLVGMPVLVTGLLATMGMTAHESTDELAHVAAPVYTASEPVTTLIAKPKPTPSPNRWVAPVQGYHLTARFGASSGLWANNHTGLDFAAPSGTAIRAISSGVVTSAGYDGAYGQKTVIKLKDGTELWFCHQSTIDIRVGQGVRPGQVIGTVGSTGNVTGPHLHLEVRPSAGQPADPFAALARHGVRV